MGFFGLRLPAVQGSIFPSRLTGALPVAGPVKLGSPKPSCSLGAAKATLLSWLPQLGHSWTPVPTPLGLAGVPQSGRKGIAEKVTAALATRMEGRAGVAGDRNIPRGLRIPAEGWLRSVDLQEPRGAEASFHHTPYPIPFPQDK